MTDRPAPAVSMDATSIKACCAAAYESDLVAMLLGASFHPGGQTLSRHLARRMALRRDEVVVDVACGAGTTAVLVAAEFEANVIGIDWSALNTTRAETAAETAGVSDRVLFRVGDAERLPVASDSVDAVISECALCTFPDKATAVTEMARVLRPSGRIGITDVTVDRARLPAELVDLAAWIACVADAQPLEVYRELFSGAGLDLELEEAHDVAAAKMLRMVDARLASLATIGHPLVEGLDVDLIRDRIALARRAVDDGVIGYHLWLLHQPSA